MTFSLLIETLNRFWSDAGYAILAPIDTFVGAGTSHPETFFTALKPQPRYCAFLQPSRRPADGRYGENPNRLQHYYQYQVLAKPAPDNSQALFLASLANLGLNHQENDIRFVEDNWENPSLGAWGLGWEVWLNGMEIAQFTYFQQMGGHPCQPAMLELTYGLERIAMALQGVDSVYDLIWSNTAAGPLSYGTLFQTWEKQQSIFNFEEADVAHSQAVFSNGVKAIEGLLSQPVALFYPAYLIALQMSYHFNLLEARRAIGNSERQRRLLELGHLTKAIATQALQTFHSPV